MSETSRSCRRCVRGPSAWTADLRWLRRQPPRVRAAFVAALARFDPPVPDPWRQRFAAVAGREGRS